MKYIGIDVSKSTFTVAYSSGKESTVKEFKNDPKGIHLFIQTVSKEEHHIVMEATGNYSILLLYILTEAGFLVSMENPYKIKNFSRMMMSSIKTDTLDARMIALYGEKMNPEPFKMKSEAILLLKQKRCVLRQLRKQLVASSNLLQSLEVLPIIDQKCTSALKKTIKFLEKQIADLEDDLTNLSNKEYKHQMELLLSVKGIGPAIASALIVATGGFAYFESAKQLTRYLGLSPNYEQSGTSVHKKGHINRMGDPGVRSQLYIAALSAIRNNQACKETFIRLKAKGKSGKLAVIAIANKLVRMAFAVVTKDRMYIEDYTSVRSITAV